MRNNPENAKAGEEGGESAPDTRADVYLQPMEETMVVKACPSSWWRGPTLEQIAVQESKENPMPDQVDVP